MGFQTHGVNKLAGDAAGLSSAPQVDVIEVLLPDTNGILRGKWLPGSAIDKVLKG